MKLSTHLVAISCAWLASSQLLVQDSSTFTLHLDALTSDPYPGFSVDLQERRLLKFEDGSEVWMSELEKLELKMRGERFFDITETPSLHLHSYGPPENRSFSYPPLQFNGSVRDVIKTLSTDGPRTNLKKLTEFNTRYYRSDTGKQSQEWLLSRISEITRNTASEDLLASISIETFPHRFPQSSIILHINGTGGTDETVIIGAHQDSTNLLFFLPAPGADDDGSGTVTILEALRGLLASGMKPTRNVEFHWYAAEEGGLLGSQDVAQAYKAASANVYAMIQMDMTAWVKSGTREEVGVVTDYVDASLTNYIKELVTAYLNIPYVETQCGYACSDHASWGKAGYPSAFAIESEFGNSNGNIHSSRDTIDVSPEFSFDHMLEFSKLAAAFAIELGEWKK